MIILVTGSRDWIDYKSIDATIDRYFTLATDRGEDLVVRHGDCPSGADHIAECIVFKMKNWGITRISSDPMPAQWQHEGCTHPKGRRRDGQWYCKAAGPLRNQAMIDKGGIFEVHAYPLPGGRGTADCVRRAVRAKLPVTNHGFPEVRMEDMLSGRTLVE